MSENLRKAVSYCAFGFLFILVDINLDFGSFSADLLFDFAGWLLFYFSIEHFGEYTRRMNWLKYAALAMTGVSMVQTVLGVIRPFEEFYVLNTSALLLQAVFMFSILGIMEVIAEDAGSELAARIHALRFFNLAIDITHLIIGASEMEIDAVVLIIIVTASAAGIVTGFLILFAMLKLRKEIRLY